MEIIKTSWKDGRVSKKACELLVHNTPRVVHSLLLETYEKSCVPSFDTLKVWRRRIVKRLEHCHDEECMEHFREEYEKGVVEKRKEFGDVAYLRLLEEATQ